jgi:xylulokinase
VSYRPIEPYILAYDLGTGGNKAALFDGEGHSLAEVFVAYPTAYPQSGWHEQKPLDWWTAVVQSTRQLLSVSNVQPGAVAAIGISGHSLGVVPLDRAGNLVRQSTPIWSDGRARRQADAFFERYPESRWYTITGNGFPAPLYPLFKLLWYAEFEPEMYSHIRHILGTKDYINYRLTGFIGTDYSYASGSGVFDLRSWAYSDELLTASALPARFFPPIVPSTQVIGSLSGGAAKALGLPQSVKVVCGGVDNSCMALGARSIQEGRSYNSQGSSSWIAVTSANPLIDEKTRPFVFAHVIPDLFTSAIGVFSTGTSFRWVRDHLCRNLVMRAEEEKLDPYDLMNSLAIESPPGANGLIFHPNMAGGSSIDPGIDIRGAFIGLDLRHTQADIIRATIEGISLQQRLALDVLRTLTRVGEEMIVVGGGSRSALWRAISAHVYNMRILKSNIDQGAAALGAAALAAFGLALWQDFNRIDALHEIESISEPEPQINTIYESILPVYIQAGKYLSDLGSQIKRRS